MHVAPYLDPSHSPPLLAMVRQRNGCWFWTSSSTNRTIPAWTDDHLRTNEHHIDNKSTAHKPRIDNTPATRQLDNNSTTNEQQIVKQQNKSTCLLLWLLPCLFLVLCCRSTDAHCWDRCSSSYAHYRKPSCSEKNQPRDTVHDETQWFTCKCSDWYDGGHRVLFYLI